MRRLPWRLVLRGFFRAVLASGAAVLLLVLLGNAWVVNNSEAYVFRNWAQLPVTPWTSISQGFPVVALAQTWRGPSGVM